MNSPNSSDLNPMEHILDAPCPQTNLREKLRDLYLIIWCQILPQTYLGLVEYIAHRIASVMCSKFGPTRYLAGGHIILVLLKSLVKREITVVSYIYSDGRAN